MAVDYVISWVQDGETFHFTDPWDPDAFDDSSGFNIAIPESEAPGYSESYQEDSYARPRSVTLTGRITPESPFVAATPDGIRDALDALAGALTEGSAGQLYRNSDRYLNARVALFRESERDQGYVTRAWMVGFDCADPFYWDATAQSAVALPTTDGGTVTLTPGGSAVALPVITLVVPSGAIGETITLTLPTSTLNPLPAALTPSVAGTYVLDTTNGTVTVGGVDYSADFTGQLLRLSHRGSSLLTVNLSSSGILTSGTIQWQRRWRSG